MRFEFSVIGNRVCIKTLKKMYTKVTYVTFEKAKQILKNILEREWTVELKDNLEKLLM